MKAIRIYQFGGPEVLKYEEVPVPEPGADEIRIRVIAAGVNPVDWKFRQGLRADLPLPMTMGLDVAGVVDKLGAKANAFRVGDEVFGKVSPTKGGYAEYTIAKPEHVAAEPKGVGFIEAAAIPTAGLTAWQALFDIAGLEKGQSVLIHGAAGGVGSFAVQFAKWKGAKVIGTASGDHVSFVKSLGADQVIDYKQQRFEQVVHDQDVVFDTVGGDTFERSWEVLRPDGFLVTIAGQVQEGEAEEHGVRAKHFLSWNDGKELAQIIGLVEQGQVKVMVATVLPLADARQAHELSESRHTQGKIVLRVAEDV